MAVFDFKRVGSKTLSYIDANFPICPACGTAEPYWALKGKIDFSDNRVQFRCDECGSIFSITTSDLSGLSRNSTNPILGLYAGSVIALNAITKTLKGKRVKTTYIKIEHIGEHNIHNLLQGSEYPIEDLQRLPKG